jgi:hypothetical protein
MGFKLSTATPAVATTPASAIMRWELTQLATADQTDGKRQRINAMSLNEFLKEHRKVEKLEASCARSSQRAFERTGCETPRSARAGGNAHFCNGNGRE